MRSKSEFFEDLYSGDPHDSKSAKGNYGAGSKCRGKAIVRKRGLQTSIAQTNDEKVDKGPHPQPDPRLLQSRSCDDKHPVKSSVLATFTEINASSVTHLLESSTTINHQPENSQIPLANSLTDAANDYATLSMPKRKRDEKLKQVDEGLRVFQGLKFFFLPDNDIAQARKLRIRRAQEYGAIWIREWHETQITHMIVDRGIELPAVLKYLRLPVLPSNIIVVNDVWPGHCIIYNHLVNHEQPQYVVPARDSNKILSTETYPAVEASETANLSLEVKEKKETSARPHSDKQSSESTLSAESVQAEPKKSIRKPAVFKSSESDILAVAIREASKVRDIPLDDSENESDGESHIDSNRTNPNLGEIGPDTKRLKLDPSKNKDLKQGYVCMRGPETANKDDGPNSQTIDVLQRMQTYYEQTQDHWRSVAYRRAISVLKLQTTKITSKEQAKVLPHIGDRLAQKIEEIVWTGKLRRLDSTHLEPSDQALCRFMKIYGVGYKQAAAFVAQGHRTLEDLLTKATITKNQRIGIDRYEDFQTRIPRAEVSKHGEFVRKTLKKVNDQVVVEIGGSYRRGAADCGDIDFIITSRNTPIETLRSQLLGELVPRLYALKYLKCDLAVTSSDTGTKWHGAAMLPGSSPPVWRRVDFLLVPESEYGAALIYFTGNDLFNRSLRLLASKKGMRLNQKGLWKSVIRGPNRERITQGTLVESQNEKAIFQALGVPWLPPEQRNR